LNSTFTHTVAQIRFWCFMAETKAFYLSIFEPITGMMNECFWILFKLEYFICTLTAVCINKFSSFPVNIIYLDNVEQKLTWRPKVPTNFRSF